MYISPISLLSVGSPSSKAKITVKGLFLEIKEPISGLSSLLVDSKKSTSLLIFSKIAKLFPKFLKFSWSFFSRNYDGNKKQFEINAPNLLLIESVKSLIVAVGLSCNLSS